MLPSWLTKEPMQDFNIGNYSLILPVGLGNAQEIQFYGATTIQPMCQPIEPLPQYQPMIPLEPPLPEFQPLQLEQVIDDYCQFDARIGYEPVPLIIEPNPWETPVPDMSACGMMWTGMDGMNDGF